MIRFSAAAALVASFLLAPAVSAADAGQAELRAELATPPAQSRLVVRDIVWRCDGATCVAPNGRSRPAIVCGALVRQTGPVRSFAVDGQALAAGELEKCNARAR